MSLSLRFLVCKKKASPPPRVVVKVTWWHGSSCAWHTGVIKHVIAIIIPDHTWLIHPLLKPSLRNQFSMCTLCPLSEWLSIYCLVVVCVCVCRRDQKRPKSNFHHSDHSCPVLWYVYMMCICTLYVRTYALPVEWTGQGEISLPLKVTMLTSERQSDLNKVTQPTCFSKRNNQESSFL